MTNETLKVLETRRSCRKFSDAPVAKEAVEAVLKAGSYAPSGMGRQPVITLVVTNPEVKAELSKRNGTIMGVDIDPFYGAPVVVVVLADKSSMTYLQDGSLAMGNMLNAAHSLGLSSIWVHRAKEVMASEYGQELLKSLGIEGDYEGIANLCLGYGEAVAAKPRKENFAYFVD